MIPRLPKLSSVPIGGKVGVIGAGVSGLSFAYFLNKLRPDIGITIFESQKKTGGWINTIEIADSDSVLKLEKGPRTLRGVSDGTLLILDSLIQNGHKNDIMVMKSDSVANRKFLLNSKYQVIPVPHSMKSFVKFSRSGLFNGAFGSIVREPFRRRGGLEDESIYEFMKRRLGSDSITNNVLSAILHGIYAGDVTKLSVNSLFPRLKSFEQEHGSIMTPMLKSLFKYVTSKKERQSRDMKILPEPLKQYQKLISPASDLTSLSSSLRGFPIVALKNTLATYPQMLTEYLVRIPQVKFVYNSRISKLNPESGVLIADKEYKFDHIRSTINVHDLGSIIQWPQLQHQFDKIEYVSIFMANIVSKLPLVEPENSGFGFLVPKSSHNKEFLLGTIFDSDIARNVQQLYPQSCTPTSIKNESVGTKTVSTLNNITMMLGGHFYSRIPPQSSSLDAVKATLHKVFGITNANFILRDEASTKTNKINLQPNDILISYNLHQSCIPQYNVGYEDIKNNVHSMLSDTKISVGGMCFGKGVGVPDCVLNSLEAALETV